MGNEIEQAAIDKAAAGASDVTADGGSDGQAGANKPLIRVPIFPREPRDLTVSDYLGKHGTGADRPGNRPSDGVDATPDADPTEGAGQYGTDFDNIPDERGIEAAIDETRRGRQLADARVWMAENLPPKTSAPVAEQAGDMSAFDVAARRVSDAVISPAKSATAGNSRALADIAGGVLEAPRQILGGIRDATQSTIDFADWLTDASANELQPMKDGAPSGDPVKAGDKGVKIELPTVKAPKTATGALVRGVTQFLTGFAGAGKLMAPLKIAGKVGETAAATIKGTLSNFAAFEPHQHRLSNLIQEHPELANPVNAYLAAKPEDGEAEGRFKNALEGLGLGALTEGLLKGVRYLRDARRAAEIERSVERGAATEAAKPAEARPLELLGDIKLELVETGVHDATAAKSLTSKGMAPLTDGKQPVYVNFARIETPDDVKRVIADTAAAFKGDIDAARRGVRSNAQTMEAAGSVDAWEALVTRRHGAPMNAEESLAARRLWEASAAKLLDVADVAARSAAPEDLFQFRKMLAIHKAIQQEVIAARTETARALQSWRIPAGGDEAGRLNAIESVLSSYGGAETAQLLAAKVAALKNVPQGLSALNDVAQKGALAKTLGAAKEIWINSLLSNPQTHIVNIMGNAAGLLANMYERAVAARYSQLLGSGDVLPGEAAALAYGSRAGAREGLRLFVNALRTGQPQFEAQATKATDLGYERALSSAYLGMTPDNWMAKAVDGLGTVVNQPVRFLSAEDDFFKAVAYRQEVQAQAFRQATREVQSGQIPVDGLNARIAELAADPPASVRLDAQNAASYLTYTEKPGKFVEALNRLDHRLAASGSPAGQLGSLAMRVLIPFRNTPANLIKYSFERTPLAPLMQHYREAISQGGAAADIARTRMALGTMTLLGLMDFALDGNITGAGPKGEDDKGTRATLLRAGWQPYSIKVGDKYVSYKRTDPMGLSIAMAADIAEMINNADLSEDKVEQIGQVIAASAASFGNSVLDKTYMSSMSDFIDVLHNNYKAAPFAQRIAAGFMVPNVLTIPRRMADPYTRYTHDLITKLRDRIPGLSSSLPPARDMWGRLRQFQSGMGEQYDAVSPYYVRTYKPEPIDAAALKHDFNLTMPQWQIGFGAGSINLRHHPEIYSRWLELRGTVKPGEMRSSKAREVVLAKYGNQAMLPLLNDIVAGKSALSGAYDVASGGRNGGKDKMITKIIGDYQRAAKMSLLDDPAVQKLVDRKQARHDEGAAGKDRTPAAFADDGD